MQKRRKKSNFTQSHRPDLPKPTESDISKIIKSLDTNKATGPDGIFVNFVKVSYNVIDSHLHKFFAFYITENKYSQHAKTAKVRPIFKKDERTKIKKLLACKSLKSLL